MAIFFQKQTPKNKTSYLPVLILALVLFLFVFFTNKLSTTNWEHEKNIVKNAVERTIIQCYALEGTYPYDLTYLEEHYGLTYNKEHFYIDYQYIGGNLHPDVTG